jgi:hypothetical protein
MRYIGQIVCVSAHVNDAAYASVCWALTASFHPLWQHPTRGTATQSASTLHAWNASTPALADALADAEALAEADALSVGDASKSLGFGPVSGTLRTVDEPGFSGSGTSLLAHARWSRGPTRARATA